MASIERNKSLGTLMSFICLSLFCKGVAALTLTNGPNITVAHGQTTTVYVAFLGNGTDLYLEIENFTTITGMLDHSSATGQIDLGSTEMQNISFGSHDITVTLTDDANVTEISFGTLFYEETISGLTATNQDVIIDKEKPLCVNILSGSNVVSTWRIDGNLSLSQKMPGIVRELCFVTVFDAIDVHTIEVEVKNSITDLQSESFTVEVVNPVTGFDVTYQSNETVFGTDYGEVDFLITLDNSSSLNMGSLYFDLSYNNVTTKTVSLNNYNLKDGLIVSYAHTKQGYFTIVAQVYSQVDSQSFTFNLSIWDNITFPSIKAFVSTNDNIFIHDYTLQSQMYQYQIDYGNGQEENSAQDILVTGRTSLWSHNYSLAGAYTITISVANPVYSFSMVKSIMVLDPIPDLTLEPTPDNGANFVPMTQDGAEFKIKLASSGRLSQITMACLFVFEPGVTSSNVSVLMTNDNPYVTTHTYSSTGYKDVTAICANEISSRKLTTHVTVLSPISGFQVIGHNVHALIPHSSVIEYVNFTYSGGDHITTKASLYTDPMLSLNISFDPIAKYGSIPLSSDMLAGCAVGTYKMDITLESISGEVQIRDVALFYDEKIEGFQISQEDDLNLVGQETRFDTVYTSGSNQQIELLLSNVESFLDTKSGVHRNFSFDYVFTTPLIYNVTYVSRNTLSTQVMTNLRVEVLNSVRGFTVEMANNPINSFSYMTFITKLDSSNRLPMGTLNFIIDFGDGHSMNMTLNDKISSLLSTRGYRFTHFYTKQSNRNVTVSIQAELTSQDMNLTAMIWDDITSLTLKSVWTAEVDQLIKFDFVNFMSSGFEYTISFGDDTVIENSQNVLDEMYNETTKYHSFSKPDVYDVTVRAWNFYYVRAFQYRMTIQYPIPVLLISPLPLYMIPLPNGKVDFSIEMETNNPPPTNVTCTFRYEASRQPVNESLDINYGQIISKQHIYTSGGTKVVNFTCVNYVTARTLLTSIEVKPVVLEDYKFDYPLVVPMNMTNNAEYIPVNVTFIIQLFDCVRFSPNTTFSWDFGDGSYLTITDGKTKSHTFKVRNRFNVTVSIQDLSREVIRILPIKIGAVDFYLERYVGDVSNAVFNFSLQGIGVGGTYDLFVSSKEIIHHEQNTNDNKFTHLHTYEYYIKQYRPNIIARNENYTEILYYDEYVKVDFNMSVVVIRVTKRTLFPPGGVFVTTSLQNQKSTPLPFVTCYYDMGDYIDYNIYQKTQNISFEDPLIFYYQYRVLGNLTAKITCSNNFDTFSDTAIVESYNDCFTINGIFDRQYSNSSHPMKVYTSVDFDLASRMGVHCVNQMIEFNWTLYTIDENGEDKFFDYTPVAPPTGIFRFAKGSVPENLYKVALNVSLLGKTWIYEPTFLLFVKPPPFAYIEGGNERYVKMWKNDTTIDARTSSYDVSHGYGANENLDFQWTCKVITATSFAELSEKYLRKTENSIENCQLSNKQSGIVSLTLMDDLGIGYAITVDVTLKDSIQKLSGSFTQLILGTFSQAPDVVIKCLVNCDKKYATMSKSILKAECMDCGNNTSDLQYQWSLKMIQNSRESMVDLDKVTSGTTNEMLAIKENTLERDTNYSLTVKVNRAYEADEEEVTISFRTNKPPEGGACKASNHSATGRAASLVPPSNGEIPVGIASSTLFAILCENWKDEGLDDDTTAAEIPLIYEFLMTQNVTDDNNGETESVTTSIHKGGESTASELRFPAGETANDFIIDIKVNIFDRFGDWATQFLKIKVLPNELFTIKDEDDIESSQRLIGSYEDNYDMTNAGGNNVAIYRLINAVTQSYKSVTFKNSSIKTDTSTLDKTLLYDETATNDVQIMLQENTVEILSKISSKVPENSSLVILPADCRLIAKSIQSSISNVEVMSENASAEVSVAANSVITNVQKVAGMVPFPMTEYHNIKEATADVIGALSGNIEYFSTASKENLNVTFTRNMVRDELSEYYRYHPDGIDGYPVITEELVDIMWKKKQKIRERQTNMANSTKSTVTKMLSALDTAMNITSGTTAFGEGETVIRKANLNISVEKTSVDALRNQSTVRRDGFSLDFSNDTFENVTSPDIDLQVSVFKKSPLIHANGDHQVKGQIMGISARDANRQEIELPLTMTIQNEGVAFSSEYVATTGENIEFISTLQDENDAVLIYVQPEGFDETNIDDYNYTVLVNSKISPTVNEYAFAEKISTRSWTTFGFKVFVPSGTLEPGNIIIAMIVVEGPSQHQEDEPTRRKRSVETDPTVEPPLNDTLLTNISISIVTTGCRVYDSSTDSWSPNSCSVLPFSTLNETVCRCPPGLGKFFATSFLTPNLIDFRNVFGKFDASNAAVYATMIGLLLLYVICVIFLRKKDKKDVINWLPVFLGGSNSSQAYFYMITLHTGLRPRSGTRSNVCCVVAGDRNDSGIRILSDGNSKGFETGSVKSFIMGTDGCLGDLSYMRIWHDGSGNGNYNSWFLHKIIIHDLQNKQTSIFMCDKWFSTDIGDGLTDRVLPALTKSNLGFEVLLSQHTRMNFTDSHIWLSVLVPRHKSSFTRVQRLTCILVLLFLAMITNAMFFQSEEDEKVIADSVQIGGFRLSLRTAYASLVGAMISILPLFLITYLFRNAKSKTSLGNVPKDRSVDHIEDGNGRYIPKSEKEDVLTIEVVDKGKLPHWAVYIAWILAVLAVTCSAFFLLLYSMQWGTAISNEWLATFFLSFFESIFIVDPFKVLLLSLMIAVLTRKPSEEDEIKVDIESVRRAACVQPCTKTDLILSLEMKMAKYAASQANAKEILDNRQQQLKKERAAKKAFINLVVQFLFAGLIFIISYVSRDERTYQLRTNIENQLFVGTKTQFGFVNISTQEGFFVWFNRTFVPTYYPTSSYNGGGISVRDKFFISDMANLRLGLIRLRQIRVQKDKCLGLPFLQRNFCGRQYSSKTESTDSFCKDCTVQWTEPAWKYTTSDELWGSPTIGRYSTYGGGGFILNLDDDFYRIEKMIGEIANNRWIDRLTRAVMVEFTLYNSNINMMVYVIFMTELPEVGGVLTWFDAQCFSPTNLTDATGLLSIICNAIYLIIIIGMSINLIIEVKKTKCQALCDFWNCVDVIICLLGYAAFVVWVFKYINTKKALAMYYKDPSHFVNFQHIVIWEQGYTCILGALCFISTLRLLKALGYNKRLTEIATVLKVGGKDLISFFIIFFIAFTGFVLLGNLLFGPNVYEWRNISVSFGSLTNTLIGRNSLDTLVKATPNFAEIYFFVYVFFMIFTLMTVFIAVLNHAIEEVRKGYDRSQQTIGISDILRATGNDVLQMFGIHFKNNKINTQGNMSEGLKLVTANVRTRESFSGFSYKSLGKTFEKKRVGFILDVFPSMEEKSIIEKMKI